MAPQPDPTVMPVFIETAHRVSAPLVLAGRVEAAPSGEFVYEDGTRRLILPAPALVGAHQYINAATALTALAHSRFAARLDVPGLATQAMQDVRWPGRLQRLTQEAQVIFCRQMMSCGLMVRIMTAVLRLWLQPSSNGGSKMRGQSTSCSPAKAALARPC